MDKLGVVRALCKTVALALGAVATLLCLMAVVGHFTANGWARAGVGLLMAIVVPAVIADRLLPNEPDEKSKGLAGDVFALTWAGFPAVFAVALGGLTSPLLANEGDRLTVAGRDLLAKGAYLLAGVDPSLAPAPAPTEAATSAAASSGAPPSSASAPASAPTVSAAPAPTAQPPAGSEVNAAQLFKKLAPAVVTLSVKGVSGEGGGTGFIIDKDGTIVTNHHVIDDANECTVKTLSGTTYDEVWVLADDAQADLALLKIDLSKPKTGTTPEPTVVALGDSEKVEVGEPVFVIGNPLGLEHTLTTGIISARRTYEGKKWIQMTAPISPGNSGGPVFDGHGNAIGVATGIVGYGRGQNLNLAVPSAQLKAMIKPDYPAKRKLGKAASSGNW